MLAKETQLFRAERLDSVSPGIGGTQLKLILHFRAVDAVKTAVV